MKKAGYSAKTRLAFDRACVTYVQRYRRMRDKTKQVSLPPDERRRKPKPTKTVAFHTEEEILTFLGVNVEEEGEAVGQLLGQLDAEMWDATPWGDEEDGDVSDPATK